MYYTHTDSALDNYILDLIKYIAYFIAINHQEDRIVLCSGNEPEGSWEDRVRIIWEIKMGIIYKTKIKIKFFIIIFVVLQALLYTFYDNGSTKYCKTHIIEIHISYV